MTIEEVYASLVLRFIYPLETHNYNFHNIIKNTNKEENKTDINTLSSKHKKMLSKLFFALEEAHWFYLDFYSSHGYKPFKIFISEILLFLNLSFIQDFYNLSDFGKAKYSIPVSGTIIFDKNKTHILLVRGFRKSRYYFPVGKLKQGESRLECAVRETEEEIGINISESISKLNISENNNLNVKEENSDKKNIKTKNKNNKKSINDIIHVDDRITLYVVTGISKRRTYKPICRNEIKEIKWVPIKELIRKYKQDNKINNNKLMEDNNILDDPYKTVRIIFKKYKYILEKYYDVGFKIDRDKILKYFQ
ncbi:mRNA-decapping enzyme 2 [Spraguea lophii 42_110]|uniref:mRNA-decapping enzyme 2 n=1 Tax=Spraguea lophii (strain 42_110) TaxID=1358809 RepID=S7W7E0_SPRLO|nr:mRNA-decapping enzyme 2 [Spraguea lophii 42_110]